MGAFPQSIHNYRLHRAALEGDDQAVRHALDMGADINALDEEGRTPIMCAIAGKWCVLSSAHINYSLFKHIMLKSWKLLFAKPIEQPKLHRSLLLMSII